MPNFDLYREVSRDIEPPVISLENVTKDYVDGLHAVKNLSLQIDKGEFVFIVGSSGSGKSTLIKLLGKPHHRQDPGHFSSYLESRGFYHPLCKSDIFIDSSVLQQPEILEYHSYPPAVFTDAALSQP